MKNNGGFKILTIVALVIAVIGVSVGFAAFTTTLTINATTATIPAGTNNLNTTVTFGTASTLTSNPGSGTAVGTASGQTWAGSTAVFTSSVRSIQFQAPINNTSSYIVYLSSMSATSGAKITCSNGSGNSAVSSDLYTSYCQGTTATYAFGDSTVVCNYQGCTTTLKSVSIPKTSGSSNVTLTVSTLSSSTALPDGTMTVSIPGITLGFTTTKP